MRIKIFILALFISLNLWAQKEGFVIRGYIPGMPDGVKVTLMEKEGKRSTKAETIVKDERFELKGRVESPQAFMLITNNMEIHGFICGKHGNKYHVWGILGIGFQIQTPGKRGTSASRL